MHGQNHIKVAELIYLYADILCEGLCLTV